MKTDNPRSPALEVDGVSHAFGARKALNNVSLTIVQGGFCALLGLNGAGKTTLFSLITRLYDNTSGAIRVMGNDVRRHPTRALGHLGVVFQSRTLDPDLSVMQNMFYHGALHGLPGRIVRERAREELARIGLEDRASDKVRNLSGGQARRVEIARALLHEPSMLLLDEPTVGLDIGARQDIVAHVRRLVEERGLGVLWATHLIDEIESGDDVVVLHEGNVMACGRVDGIIADTAATDLKTAFNILTGRETAAADEAAE